MMRSTVLLAAMAITAGLMFTGSAQAAAIAPTKVQAKTAEEMSPFAEAGRKKHWRKNRHHARRWHRHNRKLGYHHHKRYRYRPYIYDPYFYDPYVYGFGYGYGYGYGGYCYRPGVRLYWGY